MSNTGNTNKKHTAEIEIESWGNVSAEDVKAMIDEAVRAAKAEGRLRGVANLKVEASEIESEDI